MSTTPTRPKAEPEITDEEMRIIDERTATTDQDEKQGVPLRQAVKEGRAKLKTPAPR